ncbi:FAD-dependent oxidoreductase [Mycolicibacterium gilvum]|uniref:Nitrite reductase (NAD(P)H) large subunit n=1 Tax=Mycolicibacterium gilvum TaxID=1804 RepID=A0A378SN67_9MYCO|nr:FAD-dependent oxidoreductase [Mycolicibacterium gilvum]STZ44143.1 nitrite reductase (NAD(P)H) large subunit [Mycolicibacterium gilvum]
MAQRLVVVGNGMAGIRALEEVLARGGGDHREITVFGDEPYGNYNRILLSNVLAGVDDPAEIYLNTMDWYTDNGIDLRAGVRVVRLDTFAHLVHADDGTTLHYDKLILATGSRSFFPPMTGLWADDKTLTDGVFGFRTLDDTATMIAEAANRTKAVVIGGGLLGLEAARGLQNRGLTVDVVHAGPTLMNAQLDDPAGAILRKSVENLGIGVHTGKRTTEVIVGDDGRLAGISFADGSALDCDMLVIMYWFSRSQGHVSFESRFEMTALMTVDFRGDAIAVSSNPFWLLWPKGQTHHRHGPGLFHPTTRRISSRCRRQASRSSLREGSAPASTHSRCMSRVGLGVRGIHNDRQDCRTQPTAAMRLPPSAVRTVSRSTIRYHDLRESIGAKRRAIRRADRQRFGRS